MQNVLLLSWYCILELLWVYRMVYARVKGKKLKISFLNIPFRRGLTKSANSVKHAWCVKSIFNFFDCLDKLVTFLSFNLFQKCGFSFHLDNWLGHFCTYKLRKCFTLKRYLKIIEKVFHSWMHFMVHQTLCFYSRFCLNLNFIKICGIRTTFLFAGRLEQVFLPIFITIIYVVYIFIGWSVGVWMEMV